MTAGAFSEWRKLPVSLSELCINTTLRCGQSFRWHNVPDSDEWRCVLHGRLLSLKQDPTNLYYRTYLTSPPPAPSNPKPDDTPSLLTHYFNLSSNLTTLYAQWSSSDPNFRKKAPQFTGIRILRQDAWEALVSFICSSNNNIARISQMVEKLCVHYGPFVASVGGRAYHDFPGPEALTGADVEGRLRELGFGYRAKYIYQTAVIVAEKREKGWLGSLANPEFPAFGESPADGGDGGEMEDAGREGYRRAHEGLLELQGVGPKVADCVCLMGLGWGESVPVDTHVWQIAQRDYKFGKGSHKSLTKATYDAVGNHFRKLWGKDAGWAHSVLFTADLKSFSDRLATSKKSAVKVDVDVKEEPTDGSQVKVETKVTTAVAVKREAPEDGVKSELEDVVKTEPKDEGEEDVGAVVKASQTRTTRRMSKRLKR
ncbi:DNA N-glycosylase [Aspergillus campestris IBT 28561]|uniref:DNA-(apurinic or apyrimidinic site) lyase n=1 Tax=Aspergillus campestris (strain IBT 28561) TaxID=1392248 RepID=A0A2I1D595_ASPC2|nr:DNA N-glycosylase [Aspergillus campestris IBT 28561]PKY05040.1 DNA N-glycosylase [Aspergillus campestris IBT 28561]